MDPRRQRQPVSLLGRVIFFTLCCVFGSLLLLGFTVDVRLLYNVSAPAPATATQMPVVAAPPAPRILYMLYSTPSLANRMATARFTWMQRINHASRVLFVSDGAMPCEVPDVIQNDTKKVTKDNPLYNLGYKELRLWEHVIDNDTLLDEFDFFYKVDDDSYVIPQNIDRLVARYDKRSMHYVGRLFKLGGTDSVFTPGGPGYILSWAVLQRLKRNPFPIDAKDHKWVYRCKKLWGSASDVAIGACLAKFGILPTSAWGVEDGEGELFQPFHVEGAFINNGTGWWYGEYAWYGHRHAERCCSRNMVAFHFMDDAHCVALDFLLFGMRPVIRRNETMSALLRAPYADRKTVFCWAFQRAIDNLNWTLAPDSPPMDEVYCNQKPDRQHIFLKFAPLTFPNQWCPSAPDSNVSAVSFPQNTWCGPLSERRIEAWRCVDFNAKFQHQLRSWFAPDQPDHMRLLVNFLVNELRLES